LRQQGSAARAAHTARLSEAHAEAAELRKQNKSLTNARADALKRLERAEAAVAAQTKRADGEQRRVESLNEQHQELQQQLVALDSERGAPAADLLQARTEVGRLTTQVQDTVAERDRLRAECGAVEQQLAQLSETSGDQERVLAQQLDAARTAGAQLE